MSAAASPTTGRPYGVALVCQVLDVPRSTYYAQAPVEAAEPTKRKRRGPRPKISDDALLAAIKHDLERSPFVGEGHRKVHARLRVLDKIRVSKTRALRLMRENNLLSPHRSRQGEAKAHDGMIITDEPNVMWGTDGAKVFTLDDGWVWVFATVEHWNAECVGWHVCKHGSRFNALEAVKMGVEEHFGSVDGDVARGLSLRMDHGSQYISDHFRVARTPTTAWMLKMFGDVCWYEFERGGETVTFRIQLSPLQEQLLRLHRRFSTWSRTT